MAWEAHEVDKQLVTDGQPVGRMKAGRIPVLDEIPEGWGYAETAATAPAGYKWICNKKPRFSAGYRHALLRVI